MSYMDWANSKMKKLDVIDIKLIKIYTAAFVLMVAALWPPIASLNWYWYLIIALIAMIRPLKKVFF